MGDPTCQSPGFTGGQILCHPCQMAQTPAQLANLRPVSRDPEIARAQARKTGFGTPSAGAQCQAIAKSTGKRCRDVAAFGTPVCVKHGARRYAGTPASPHAAVHGTVRVLRSMGPPPLELTRTPQWQAADKLGRATEGLTRKLILRAAWESGEWRKVKDLV